MQRRLAHAGAVIVVLWLHLALCQAADTAGGGTAYVAAGAADGYSSLVAAFQNQKVTTIVLATNYSVGEEFEPFMHQPVLVARNVTITGLPGTTPLLDLNRQAGVVQLCASCTLRLANISLANMTHSGTGAVMFFRGQIGARVLQQNGYSIRLVCQSTDVELEVVNQTQRSAWFSSPCGGGQLAGSVDATYLGRSFPGSFRAADVSTDVPLTLTRPGTFSGGFAMQWLNVTRLCWSYVSQECVAREAPEVCVAVQMQQMMAAAAGSDGGAQGRRVAAVAVPVAVGGALLLAALSLLLLLHRRRRRRQASLHPNTTVLHHTAAGRLPPSRQPPAAAGKQQGDESCIEVVLSDSPAAAAAAPAAAVGSAGGSTPELPVFTPMAGAAPAAVRHDTAAGGSGSAMSTGVRSGGNLESGSALSGNNTAPNSGGLHSGPCNSMVNAPLSALVPLAVATGGWQLTSSRTTRGLQQAADTEGSEIQWGELLGAGSFGRVYKCRWAGMDVAVKVIQHDAAALSAVENEVQLQMYLNHPNINANNVLVSTCDSSPNGLVAKLADLGLSRVINQQRSHRTTHTFGTLSHMPPCLLREGRLTTRADVYAFAMVMWQLFTGEPAWHGLHYGQFFQKVVLEHSRPPVLPDMPEDYTCLMTHCWAEEPNDRPTASVVLHCLDLMIQERMRMLGDGNDCNSSCTSAAGCTADAGKGEKVAAAVAAGAKEAVGPAGGAGQL